jgi:DNA (cytosine-5)-methyltransferase 1
VKDKMPLNVVDLFCGSGGFSHGFERAGFNIVLGIDNFKSAIETFKANHKEATAICRDMREITKDEILNLIGDKRIHVVIGGPPCQGFSLAGRRNPSDERNSLFNEYLRVVEYLKPEVFIMENVTGLLSMKNQGGEKVIDLVLQRANRAGYKTDVWKILAADYGVPQRRKRIFIVGSLNGIQLEKPASTHSRDESTGKMWKSVDEVLIGRDKAEKSLFYSKKLIAGFKRREKLNKKNNIGFGWQFLNLEMPSYTISARYWKDGAEALVRYSDGSIRMLSEKECARIQSFPDSYLFSGNSRDVYTQIGNAVPPRIGRKIGEAVAMALKPFEDECLYITVKKLTRRYDGSTKFLI